MLLSVLICFYGKKISVSEFLRSARSSFLLFPIKKENRQRLYNLLSIFILKLILFSEFSNIICKSPCRTDFFTLSASDTFRVIGVFHRVNLHLTDFCTGPAMSTKFFIHLIMKYRNGLEQRIHCSKRTDVLTKRPVNNYRKYEDCCQKEIFPTVKPAYCSTHSFIQQYQRKEN